MEKENIYRIVRTMIVSSTHQPKYMSVSSVKLANLMDLSLCQIEESLSELVIEGRLRLANLSEPPYREVYFLPEQG